jgi:hypothetical protein
MRDIATTLLPHRGLTGHYLLDRADSAESGDGNGRADEKPEFDKRGASVVAISPQTPPNKSQSQSGVHQATRPVRAVAGARRARSASRFLTG